MLYECTQHNWPEIAYLISLKRCGQRVRNQNACSARDTRCKKLFAVSSKPNWRDDDDGAHKHIAGRIKCDREMYTRRVYLFDLGQHSNCRRVGKRFSPKLPIANKDSVRAKCMSTEAEGHRRNTVCARRRSAFGQSSQLDDDLR